METIRRPQKESVEAILYQALLAQLYFRLREERKLGTSYSLKS